MHPLVTRLISCLLRTLSLTSSWMVLLTLHSLEISRSSSIVRANYAVLVERKRCDAMRRGMVVGRTIGTIEIWLAVSPLRAKRKGLQASRCPYGRGTSSRLCCSLSPHLDHSTASYVWVFCLSWGCWAILHEQRSPCASSRLESARRSQWPGLLLQCLHRPVHSCASSHLSSANGLLWSSSHHSFGT